MLVDSIKCPCKTGRKFSVTVFVTEVHAMSKLRRYVLLYINIVFFFLANSMQNLFFVYCFVFFSFFYFLYYIIFIYYFLIMEKTNLNLFLNIWKKWQNMTNRDRLLCLRKDLKLKFFFFHKLFVSSFSVLRDQNVEIRNLMFLFMMPFHL